MSLQSVLAAIYPPACVHCGTATEADFALCGPCWRDAWFIGGTACTACGAPLQGEPEEGGAACDDCLATARPWSRGVAVMEYRDAGRALILRLKHGDGVELARTLGAWMARAAAAVLPDEALIVPVPLHWTRLWRRRYNQAALLARRIGAETGREVAVDALVRSRRTLALDGHSREARFRALDGAIAPHPRRGMALRGRPVLLVDDVMTSGATLAAATDAALAAGAAAVNVLVLARATRGP
ncbi:ComF family protein [Wenxinia marina]|uniref:Putative amidophosphoribosyltransferase n=1 Tax=Wenxinia marina DSM 24838 TaxID=1123501 RepID=A0A0D0QFC9_9RHOB|nr:double zinc ribbon domain-containing protein [Wenxinia marina]KIQ71022.1 putative amidophosphoribosyltransferase [Wenxinia marina DSM 24838]GGL55503.1 amidophosphoribosyltransferase [Wenxinia marina]